VPTLPSLLIILCISYHGIQHQIDEIEAERTRLAEVYSVVTATKEGCRLSVFTDDAIALSDVQLIGLAAKGVWLISVFGALL